MSAIINYTDVEIKEHEMVIRHWMNMKMPFVTPYVALRFDGYGYVTAEIVIMRRRHCYELAGIMLAPR